jgi:ribose-phosphate pyrophosphokinase
LTTAARILKQNGAESIYAAVTHAVLTDLGFERLKNSEIKELVVTDTVPLRESAMSKGVPIKVLSVSGLLGEAVLRIHDNQSVSSLFKV